MWMCINDETLTAFSYMNVFQAAVELTISSYNRYYAWGSAQAHGKAQQNKFWTFVSVVISKAYD